MAVELVKDEGAWILKLSGACDVFDLAALHGEACAAVDGAPGPLAVSFHAVQSVDTAATQVLLALRRAFTGRGLEVRFDGVPEPVAERWRQLGLDTTQA
jgi:anti-anti-sigma regulatory factor